MEHQSKIRIVVAGLSSKLILSIFGDKPKQFHGAQNQLNHSYEFINRNEFFDMQNRDLDESSWLLLALEPKSIDVDEKFFKSAATLWCANNLISSASVLQPLAQYTYLKTKSSREVKALSAGFSVLRLGHGFGGWSNLKNKDLTRTISPSTPVSDLEILDQGISEIVLFNTRIGHAFVVEEVKFSSIFLKVLSWAYGKACWALGPRRVCLRPIDFSLRCFGVTGYGYSYWTKNSSPLSHLDRKKRK